MAYTAQLSDTVTTLNLVDGANYRMMAESLRHGPPSPRRALAAASLLEHGSALIEEKFGNRTVSLRLQVLGSSKDNLIANIRNIQGLLEKARVRQITGFGNDVTLTLQWDGASNSFVFDVLDGQLHYPPTLWSKAFLDLNTRVVGARLELLCKPFARRAAAALASDTLENEQDSGADKNYTDIASINGDVDAPAQIKLVPSSSSGSKKTWIGTRSGTRRTDTLWRQGEGYNSFTSLETEPNLTSLSESAIADGAASDGSVLRMRTTNADATTALTKALMGRLDFTLSGPPRGLFRVLARVKATTSSTGTLTATDLSFGLGYSFGSLTSQPVVGVDTKTVSGDNTYEVLDLGEIRILPTSEPDGQSLADFNLRIFQALENDKSIQNNQTIDWFVDYVFLLPADEYVSIVNAVGATDRILIDSLSPHSHIYILDSSDKLQRVADYVGRSLLLSKQGSRIYVLRDDAPGASFAFSGSYVPRYWDLA